MKTVLSFLFIFAFLSAKAQDADAILKSVVDKLNKVEDYTVDANIKADIPMIKILPVKATLYFKQKDKFKVVSKGIAILPKQGFTDINAFLTKKGAYMAVEGGTKMVQDIKTTLITVIPTSDNSDFVLAKLWIDTKRSIILESQITTRGSGTVFVEYKYGEQVEYGLPSQLLFTVDVKKFKMPKSVAADIHDTEGKDNKKKQKDTGTITINLSNYKVNKGISDDFFKKKN